MVPSTARPPTRSIACRRVSLPAASSTRAATGAMMSTERAAARTTTSGTAEKRTTIHSHIAAAKIDAAKRECVAIVRKRAPSRGPTSPARTRTTSRLRARSFGNASKQPRPDERVREARHEEPEEDEKNGAPVHERSVNLASRKADAARPEAQQGASCTCAAASGASSTSTKRASFERRGLARRPAAGEEVEHDVARLRSARVRCGVEDAERLLRRVAGLLAAVRRHDRVPPHVGRRLAARGLLGSDEPRRHVRDAVDRVVVEDVVARGSSRTRGSCRASAGQRFLPRPP